MPQPEKVKVTFLGVATGGVDPALRAQLDLPEGVGLVVHFVQEGSPAAKAGIKPYSVLHKVGDQVLINREQLATLLQLHKPGDKVTLTVITGGKSANVDVTLGEREVTRMPMPPNMPNDNANGFRIEGGVNGNVFELRNVDPDQMAEQMRQNLRKSGLDEEHINKIVDQMRKNFQEHQDMQFRLRRVEPGNGDPRNDHGDAGHPGEPPHINIRGNGEAHAQSIVIGANGNTSMSMSYSDGEHTLKVTGDKDSRKLVATDKNGKVLFDGPIDLPEQRAKIPADIRAKLDRLEETTRIEIHVNPGQPGGVEFNHRPQPQPRPEQKKKEKPVDI
ncbi:MAG: PDZ domain-containing protein [Phycisphaera sp.]|nr:PDZ domain-containing protein [Phycisphaera sp.]